MFLFVLYLTVWRASRLINAPCVRIGASHRSLLNFSLLEVSCFFPCHEKLASNPSTSGRCQEKSRGKCILNIGRLNSISPDRHDVPVIWLHLYDDAIRLRPHQYSLQLPDSHTYFPLRGLHRNLGTHQCKRGVPSQNPHTCGDAECMVHGGCAVYNLRPPLPMSSGHVPRDSFKRALIIQVK